MKRILTVLLTAAVLLSALSVSVFAAEENIFVFKEEFDSDSDLGSWSLKGGANPEITMFVENGRGVISQGAAPGGSNWFVRDIPATSGATVTVEAKLSLKEAFAGNSNAAFFFVYDNGGRMIAQADWRLQDGKHRLSVNDHYSEKYVVTDSFTDEYAVRFIINFESMTYDFYVNGEALFTGLAFKDRNAGACAVARLGAGFQGGVSNRTMYIDGIKVANGLISDENTEEPENSEVFKETFDDISSSDGWSHFRGENVNITMNSEDGRGVISQADAPGSSNWFVKDIPSTSDTTVTVTADISLKEEFANNSNAAFFFVYDDGGKAIAQADWRLQDGKHRLSVNDHYSENYVVTDNVTKACTIKFIISFDAKTYDFYVNGEALFTGLAFKDRNADACAVSRLGAGFQGGVSNRTMYIDNIAVYNGLEPKPSKPSSSSELSSYSGYIYINNDYHALLTDGQFICMPHSTDENGFCPVCRAICDVPEEEFIDTAPGIREEFDSKSSVKGWSHVKGENADITISAEDGKCVIAQAKGPGSSNWFVKDINPTTETKVTVEAKLSLKEKFSDNSNAAFFFVYGEEDKMIAQADWRLQDGKHRLSVNDHYSEKFVVTENAADEYTAAFVINFNTMTYDFYINGERLFNDLAFKDADSSARAVARIGAGFQGGVSNKTMYLHSVYVSDGVTFEEAPDEPAKTEDPEDNDVKEPEESDETDEPEKPEVPDGSLFAETFDGESSLEGWALKGGENPEITLTVKDGRAVIAQGKGPGSSNWFIKDITPSKGKKVSIEAALALKELFADESNAAFFFVYDNDGKMIAQADWRLFKGEHRISVNDHYSEKCVVTDDVTKEYTVKFVIDFDSMTYDFFVDGEKLFSDLTFKDLNANAKSVARLGAGFQGGVSNRTMFVDNITVADSVK